MSVLGVRWGFIILPKIIRTKYTTVAICADKKVYDLGDGEYPPSPKCKNGPMMIKEAKHKVVNAFTCTKVEAKLLKAKKK